MTAPGIGTSIRTYEYQRRLKTTSRTRESTGLHSGIRRIEEINVSQCARLCTGWASQWDSNRAWIKEINVRTVCKTMHGTVYIPVNKDEELMRLQLSFE